MPKKKTDAAPTEPAMFNPTVTKSWGQYQTPTPAEEEKFEAEKKAAYIELQRLLGGTVYERESWCGPELQIAAQLDARIVFERFDGLTVSIDPHAPFNTRDQRRRERTFKCPVPVAKLKAHVALMKKLIRAENTANKVADLQRKERERRREQAEATFIRRAKSIGVPKALIEKFELHYGFNDQFEVKFDFMSLDEALSAAELLSEWWDAKSGLDEGVVR